jgi:hypothetical protein
MILLKLDLMIILSCAVVDIFIQNFQVIKDRQNQSIARWPTMNEKKKLKFPNNVMQIVCSFF